MCNWGKCPIAHSYEVTRPYAIFVRTNHVANLTVLEYVKLKLT
jgi:hypothetical protein